MKRENNILEEWKDNSELLTPQEALRNEDLGLDDLRQEINSFTQEKKVSFLLSILGREELHNKENSVEDRLTQAICRAIIVKRANEHYKKRIEKFQEKLQEETEA